MKYKICLTTENIQRRVEYPLSSDVIERITYDVILCKIKNFKFWMGKMP